MKKHFWMPAILLFPILYSGIFGWSYRNIDESHCSDYNLRQTMDYDLEACQIDGTNLIITRDGSGAYLSVKFTYPQDIEAAQLELEDTEDLYAEMSIIDSIYASKTWSPPYEEGIFTIGQYDLDEAVEISIASHPLMTYPGIHGTEFFQIDRYGAIHEEEAVWTQLFMSLLTQFAALWSYLGLVIYLILLGVFSLKKKS